jgi:hypothetical protein
MRDTKRHVENCVNHWIEGGEQACKMRHREPGGEHCVGHWRSSGQAMK